MNQATYPPVIKHGIGKSPMNGGFNRNITDFYGPFSIAMFDDTGGYLDKPLELHGV